MSKRSLPILIAAGWLITVIAGFMAGRRSGSDDTASSDSGASSSALIGDTRTDRQGRSDSLAPDRERSADRERGATSPNRVHDILSDPDPNERSRRFLDYIARLSDDDFPLVAAELSTGPAAELNRGAYSMLLSEWASRDPYAAVEYMQIYAKSDWERETVLAAWAARDPQAAFEWASGAEEAGETNNWVTGALSGIAVADPELARRLIEGMEDGPTRRNSLRNAAAAIAALGADQAAAWIEALDDEDLRRQAARDVARPLARGDVLAAGSWVSAIDDVPARRDASEVVGEQWARTDLEGARQWVESLPEDTRTEAAEGVASRYGHTDPQRGAEWLISLGDNPDLDGARRRFLDSAARGAPEVAANMVATLSNEKARTGYYYRVLGQWSHRDKSAAREWVTDNAATLPEPIVQRMLR